MISKKTIDEIFLAAKIEEVVGDFVPLKKKGQNWVGICPFHDDKNPSMYVTPRLGIFKCFVCDTAGNAVHFLMEHEKISYPEALRYLAAKYNIPIEEDKTELSAEEIAANNERESLYVVNSFAEKYFIDQLFNTEEGQNIGLTYFKERGFNEAIIKKFKLGYCPAAWDSFTQEALKNGYKLDYLLQTGLTKKTENDKLFDFYRGRVIFPIHNTLGKTVGFGGRVLKKSDNIAKYFNSPESEIYHKSDILYGFYFAKKSIRAKDNVYLVEGYTDVLSMVEAGVENVVASSGTALTDGQIKLLAAQTPNITVLYDGDLPGIKASMRGINKLVEAGLNVKVILLPDGEDPDSFAKSHRDSELMDFLNNNATNFILFKANILSQEAGDDPVKRSVMIKDILTTITDVRDEITRAFYIKECAKLFQLSEEMLNVELRKLVWKKMNKPATAPQQPTELPSPKFTQPIQQPANQLINNAEFNLISLILKYGSFEITVARAGFNDDISYEQIRIDQYIYNELHNEELHFQNPLYQTIYYEYAKVAAQAEIAEDIAAGFIRHEDKKIQDLAISILIDVDPEYSPQWKTKFDLETSSTKNSQDALTKEVESVINYFKISILITQENVLREELSHQHPTQIENQILARLMEICNRKKEIANLIKIVIPK